MQSILNAGDIFVLEQFHILIYQTEFNYKTS